MSWSYRPALDGLRALAVYLVLLFHVGVGVFTGGFVGVDLFFVLSGFLVSTILLEELAGTGRLDLVGFYDRRVRRLLPAAVVVVLAASAMSLVVLSTVRRQALVEDAQAALLYVANWRFLLESNDYFAAGAVDKSLFLHFWSLSIEEQFYFFFPLLLLGLNKLERRRRGSTVVVLSVILVGSLATQLIWAARDANHAYYGTGTRLYQLIAGALLALGFRRAGRCRLTRPALTVASLVSLLGLVLVATSVVPVSPSGRGILATLLGVALIATLAGERAHAGIRLFSHPALVFLGKISYGTYLWHWPVLILLRAVVDPPVYVQVVIVGLLSTALATASYQMLERPIRRGRLQARLLLPVVATSLAVSMLAALLVVPWLLHHDRRPDLVAAGSTSPVASMAATSGDAPVPDIDFVAVAKDRGSPETWCPPDDLAPCQVVTGRPGPNVVLVGDSYGQMLQPAMAALAREHGFNLSVSTLSGCPWPDGLVKAENREHRQRVCATARHRLYREGLRRSDADIVVLTERSRDATSGDSIDLVRPPGDDRPVRSQARLVTETVRHTFDELEAAGVRTMVVQGITEPGAAGMDPLDCLSAARTVDECRVPMQPRNGLFDSLAVTSAARSDDIFTIDLDPIMCPDAPLCAPVLDGIPVWRDQHHFTPAIVKHRRGKVYQAMKATGLFEGTRLG